MGRTKKPEEKVEYNYEHMAFLIDTLNSLQKIRQNTGNRISHLERQHKRDTMIERYHDVLQEIEDDMVNTIKPLIASHPVYSWAKEIKGVGAENLAKVIGLIERVSDEETGKHGIECFSTPSKTVRYCGFAVIDGAAEKRKSGEKLHYNSELRSMLWRIGSAILTAGLRQRCSSCGELFGSTHDACPKCNSENYSQVATSRFAQFYLDERQYLETRAEREGKIIMPTPKGKICPQCVKEVKVKTGKYCPDCGTKLENKKESDKIIFKGHLHSSALRRMIRMFVIMLDTEWREKTGLPVRTPYPAEHLGHSTIYRPNNFIDS